MKREVKTLLLSLILLTNTGEAASIYGRVFDTLDGEIFKDARIVLMTTPAKETTTDARGQYWFRDIKPGPYLVKIIRTGQPEVVGRLVVSAARETTIVNLDLAKIEPPEGHDEY